MDATGALRAVDILSNVQSIDSISSRFSTPHNLYMYPFSPSGPFGSCSAARGVDRRFSGSHVFGWGNMRRYGVGSYLQNIMKIR